MRVITFLFTYILFIISSLASPLQLGYGNNLHKETHFTQTDIIYGFQVVFITLQRQMPTGQEGLVELLEKISVV